MSSGPFVATRYQISPGKTPGLTETVVVPIRVQEETLTLTIGGTSNDQPTDGTNFNVSATVSRGANQNGILPRKVRYAWVSTPPAGYSNDGGTVVILQEAFWNAISDGDTGTYLGQDIRVTGKSDEKLG